METDEIVLNDLLPDEILIKIFEYYDYKVLMNMSLVSPRWLELIGNTGHIYEKFPLVINDDNLGAMTKPKVKLLRQYKPPRIVAENIKYSDIADKPKICEYFAGAKTVKFDTMGLAEIRDILNLCQNVEKLIIKRPAVLPDDGEPNEMRAKRLKLGTTSVHLVLSLRRNSEERDEFEDLLRVLEELNIEVTELSLSFFSIRREYVEFVVQTLEYKQPNCIITSLNLNHSTWSEDEYTSFVERCEDAENIQLTHFGLPHSDTMKETDLIQLLSSQTGIKNLEFKRSHTDLLKSYAVDNMPQLECFKTYCSSERPTIAFFVDAIKDLKWPNLRELQLLPALKEMNLGFFELLPHLESFETYGGVLELPPLKGPLKKMRAFVIQEVKLADGFLQQLFKNMPNLKVLQLQLIDDMTPEMLCGAGEDYSIGNLTNLEELSLDGEWMASKELRALMKYPYLKQLNLGKKWGDNPIRDKDMHLLGVQCPNLMTVHEPGEGEDLWARDAKTRRFENMGNQSSSEEISHSSGSDCRTDDCSCSSDDCDCVSMMGAWRDIQPRYGAGSDPMQALNGCAQQ